MYCLLHWGLYLHQLVLLSIRSLRHVSVHLVILPIALVLLLIMPIIIILVILLGLTTLLDL